MNILMIGDIVSRAGRRAVRELLSGIVDKYDIDFVVANGENAAGGNGITREIAFELYQMGIDVITMGNHVWDNRDIFNFIDSENRILRPDNYPEGTPGRGFFIYRSRREEKIGVINLSGRVFLANLDCPFRLADRIVAEIAEETNYILVDFHAEATSEKVAFGWYLDGRVSAVVGTHTHIQTADERVLPGGTAFITDVGMTGPRDSVLGIKVDLALQKFRTQMPVRFEAASGVAQLNAVAIEVNDRGKAEQITRIQRYVAD
jgi:metallophosphoesterase (TIGR00282 family)